MDEPVRLCTQRQQVLQSRALVLGPQRFYIRDDYLLRGVLCLAEVMVAPETKYDHDHVSPEAFKR